MKYQNRKIYIVISIDIIKKMETKTTKHTLEKVIDSMGGNFDEERVHTAMLLSFAESVLPVRAWYLLDL